MKGKKIILGVSGSIAAYKGAALCSKLRALGAEVRVIMTAAAQHFVAPQTFQSLSQNQVITDLFVSEQEYSPRHISLARWTDLLVIAPATLNLIGKLASGIADDALTCTVFASTCPVVIAPAMNDRMYAHPVCQANIERLKELGYSLVGPVEGRLSDGTVGKGRLAEVGDIVSACAKALGVELEEQT